MTRIYLSDSSDTYFNLATEEYLLQNKEEDYIFIYENHDSVVIGKHQNVWKECRINRCTEKNVAIARRLSGGGTVFHGSGNVNFSFIKNLAPEEPLIDFKKHLEPVIQFLRSLELPAEFSGRNDILINGLKVSGNAEHVFQKKRRLIHHGTLLFNADIQKLKSVTEKKTQVDFKTHAVDSVRSNVANIQDLMADPITKEKFVSRLFEFFQNTFNAENWNPEPEEIQHIQKLQSAKYETKEWIIHYSPGHTLTTPDGWKIEVKKGMIINASFGSTPIEELLQKTFEPESFKNIQHRNLRIETDEWF